MNDKEILARVRDILAATLDQPDLAVTSRTTAQEVPGWDSFNHVNIVLAIENEFGVSFHSAEVEDLRGVGDIVRLVAKKLPQQGSQHR